MPMEVKVTDKKLLISLVSIQSTTRHDEDINAFIEKTISEIDGVSVKKDSFGNIYGTKGSGANGYKCIVAHTDTVHSFEKDRLIYMHGDNLFAMAKNQTTSSYSYYKNDSLIKQVGVGGDDRAGIYTAILALRDFDDIKAAFFRFEETGCNGSEKAEMDFFADCNFVVQCDRKGSSDFITHTNGIKIASKEFEEDMKPIIEKFGYSIVRGVSTDVGQLKHNGLEVCAVNLSSGYHDAHTDRETINISQLENCYDLVKEMFSQKGEIRYEHKYEPPVVTSFENNRSTTQNTFITNVSEFKYKGLLTDNIFTNSMDIANFISIEFEKEEPDLEEIESSGLFKIYSSDMFEIDGDHCRECSGSKGVIFSVETSEFYCSNPDCWKTIDRGDMYKRAIIEFKGLNYCYDRVNNVWILEDNSIWDLNLESYRQLV